MLFDEFVEFCEDHYADRHGIYAAAVSAAYGLKLLIEENYDVSPFFELIIDEITDQVRSETLNHVKRGWIDLNGVSIPPVNKDDLDG